VCRFDDLGQRLRREHVAQFVVKQHFGRAVEHRARLFAQCGDRRIVAGLGFGEHVEQLPRRRDPRLGAGRPLQRMQQHVAHHPSQMAAGQRVVADEPDPRRAERMCDQRHCCGAHRIGHPGINAVRDDVVETARRIGLAAVEDVTQNDLDVGHPRRDGDRLPPLHRRRREVEADDLCLRIGRGKRQRVQSVTPANLEDPRGLNRRRVDPMQPRDHPRPLRMRLFEHHAGVSDGVIGGGQIRHEKSPLIKACQQHLTISKLSIQTRTALPNSMKHTESN